VFGVYPAGVQRGAKVRATVMGLHDLRQVYRVIVSGKGVTASPVVPEKGWPANPTTFVEIELTAAADAVLGEREVRVVTPRGVSSVGLVFVGDEPEVNRVEPNHERSKAQPVAVPCVVNGILDRGEQLDYYRFSAKAGQQIAFAVNCARMQDKIHDLQQHADPLLVLRDAQGRELANNDDYYRADPMLIHRFAADGEYTIEIRDVNYAANPYWVYRLQITDRPYATSFLPLAVKRGSPTEVRVAGGGLNASAGQVEPVLETGVATSSIRIGSGTSQAVQVYSTDLPIRAFADAPPSAGEALHVPEVVSARLAAANEVHRYKFKAKAGERFLLEVYARRLNSRVDPQLSVLNAAGQPIAVSDDIPLSPDSRLEWQAPSDGEFGVEVRDLNNKGGRDFVYALEVSRAEADFRLRCDDDKMKLGPGNSGAWYVHVERKFGFAGPVKVEVKGLPAGVTASPLTIPANMTQGCLILTCAADAKMDVGEVEVIGTGEAVDAGGKPFPIVRRAVPESEIYLPGGGRALYPMVTQAVGITPETDIVVKLSTDSVTLTPGGTARIDVTVVKHPSLKKGVSLDVYLRHLGSVYGNPLPPGVTLDEGASKTLLGEGETQGHIVLRASADAPAVTDLPIAVLGQVSINFVVKVSYAGQPVRLTVKR
jgi:hypothetical protein